MTNEEPGERPQSNFTKRDKLLIVIFASTAAVAIILFVSTLALLIQLNGTLIEQRKQYDNLTQALRSDFNENLVRQEILEMSYISLVENFDGNISEVKKQFRLISRGWKSTGNGLYYKAFSTPMTFSESMENCKNHGSRLASVAIRSPTIRSEIWEDFFTSSSQAWIGLHQPYVTERNYTWVWSDGATYNSSSTPWQSDQPNNYLSMEDCATLLMKDGNLVLNDKRCSLEKKHVCEVVI